MAATLPEVAASSPPRSHSRSVPATAQESLRSMLVQLRQMEAQVNAYMRGLRDSLSLEGDDWTLNLESMTFEKQPKQENTNGVGATASNPKGK